MKVAFVGSREFRDLSLVDLAVDKQPEGTIIISGGARGTDTRAETRAKERGLTVISYRPFRRSDGRWQIEKWTFVPGEEATVEAYEEKGRPKTYYSFGQAAFARNEFILRAADKAIVFWHGIKEHSGTWNDLEILRRMKKWYLLIRFDADWETFTWSEYYKPGGGEKYGSQ